MAAHPAYGAPFAPSASQSHVAVAPLAASVNGRASDSDDGDAHGPGGESRKRKRNRIALSCVQCKRRKVKCSRTAPCEACVRHGIPDECKWEEGSGAEQAQPFALATDLRNLEARYGILERYVVDKLAVSSGELASLLAQAASPSTPSNTGTPQSARAHPWANGSLAPKKAEEDAAAVLEELAMGPPYLQPAPVRRASAQREAPGVATTIMLQQDLSESAERVSFLPAAELLDRLIPTLPSDQVILELLRAIDNEVMWKGAFHLPTVMAEAHEFLDARRRHDLTHVDPAYVALFLVMLCCGISEIGDFTPFVAGLPYRDLVQVAPFWMSASRAALNLSGYYIAPQLRAVQTCILYVWQGLLPFGRNKDRGVDVWFAAAARTAQSLGLHQLGSDERAMPPDDPGLPTGDSGLKRQLALRTWHQLICIDTLMSHAPPHLFMLRPGEHDSALPANVDDDDLGADVHVVERPSSQLTSGAFAIFKSDVMSMFRIALEAHTSAAALPAEQYAQRMLDLDRTLRHRLERNSHGAHAMPDVVVANLTSGYCNRLLRAHRTSAERAYAGEARYDDSMRAYLACALDVCRANASDRATPFKGMIFVTRHLLAAILALFQHRYGMIDRGTPDRDAIETALALDQAAHALEWWRSHKFKDTRYTAEKGLSLIAGLRAAEAGYRADPRRESFVAILKRVGAAGAPSEAPRGLMAPPTPGKARPGRPLDVVLPPPAAMATYGVYEVPAGDFDPALAAAPFGVPGIDVMSGMTFDWATLLDGGEPFDAQSLF